MNFVAEKYILFVRWLEKNQMKRNIITLNNDLNNANPSHNQVKSLEKRVISQLKPVPAKKLRESLAASSAVDGISSPAVGAISSEPTPLPSLIEEKKETFLLLSAPKVNIASTGSRPHVIAVKKDLHSSEEEQTLSPPRNCSMYKRENKAEDEKCLESVTGKSNPFSIPPESTKIIRYRCGKCRSIKRYRFRAPCEKCKNICL